MAYKLTSYWLNYAKVVVIDIVDVQLYSHASFNIL